MSLNITIFSYRKLSFARAFGFTVRDLMFLSAFDGSNRVSKIDWLERPDVGPEIFGGGAPEGLSEKIVVHRKLDRSIIGPILEGRGWTASSFRLHERELLASIALPAAGQRVFLDFNPFYIPPVEVISSGFYWYDLIDNFALHNRFTQKQIELVQRKYEFVERHANRVTGVTSKSVASFSNSTVIPNRLLSSDWSGSGGNSKPEFDFGFLGFITDKIDLDLLERLGRLGYRTLISGLAYDKAILERLKCIENIHYTGKFAAHEAPELTKRFKVGLVPYRTEKMHNESPIKFFQYIASGRPALMSARFNDLESAFSEYVHYYGPSDSDIQEFFERMTADYEATQTAIAHRAHAKRELFWESSLDDIFDQVFSEPAHNAS